MNEQTGKNASQVISINTYEMYALQLKRFNYSRLINQAIKFINEQINKHRIWFWSGFNKG